MSKLKDWRCATCGDSHDDLPAAVVAAPAVWFDASEKEQAEDFDLTSDTCIWKDEHFFVRGVLPVRLLDRDGSFDFGVWSTLSRENFLRYLELYESVDRVTIGPRWLAIEWPSWLHGHHQSNVQCDSA